MLKQLRRFSLKHSHELVDDKFQSIEVMSIHAMVLIIHEMFKDQIAYIGIICKFEDVLTEIVHTLKIAMIRMVESKYFKYLYHFDSECLIPS